MKSAIGKAVTRYFKTTTLHGLKYLVPRCYWDRVGWVICCVASACCAGVLCAVLWERFLNLPALLALRDVVTATHPNRSAPVVGVCEPAEAIADTFLSHVDYSKENKGRLMIALAKAIEGKATDRSHIQTLHEIFLANNLTLIQVLHRYSKRCLDLVMKCRWQNLEVPCQRLFVKKTTPWGVCCIAHPDRLANIKLPAFYRIHPNKKLELVLNCPGGSTYNGCELFTRFVDEDWISPVDLSAGFNYYAELLFTVEKDSDDAKLVENACVKDTGYSQRQCLIRSVENKCGCHDPLSPWDKNKNKVFQTCNIKQLACLKTLGFRDHNSSSACLPTCKKVKTKLILDSGPLKNNEHNLDPLTSELNVSKSIVFSLIINVEDSKMLSLIPTETWLTLLSSLGGVFNMFLGVGLFSALEFLFFVFVKLPASIRRSVEDRHSYPKPYKHILT